MKLDHTIDNGEHTINYDDTGPFKQGCLISFCPLENDLSSKFMIFYNAEAGTQANFATCAIPG